MNKTLITFFTVLFCLTSSVGWSLEYKNLVQRDGLFYKKFTEVPFNGKVDGEYNGLIKNGKKEGSWVKYHDNGELSSKGEYKNGKREGSWISWWFNGQLDSKGDYKNGKREGSWIWYDKEGTLIKGHSGTYKNGERISY